MAWDEAFARRYDEWSAHMREDVPFYVELARAADGPLVELAVGNGRVAIPVARETGRRVVGIDSSPAMLEQERASAAEAGVELDLREGDMRDLELEEPAALIYCPFRALLHCRPGPTAAAPSSVSPRRSGRADGSPGTPSPSTTGSRHGWTGSIRTSPFPTRSGTPSATTGSTSPSMTAARVHCGGQRRMSGWDSSMSHGSRLKPSMAASTDSRSRTRAANTCS
jgi:hypothetical protein